MRLESNPELAADRRPTHRQQQQNEQVKRDDHGQRDDGDQRHLKEVRSLLVVDEVPQDGAGGGDEGQFGHGVGECPERAANPPPPAGGVQGLLLDFLDRIDDSSGGPFAPVHPADVRRGLVQQHERVALLIGFHEQSIHQGAEPLIEDAFAGDAGTILHECAQVPFDRRLELPAQEAAGDRVAIAEAAAGKTDERGELQIRGHQAAEALVPHDAEVMFDLGLVGLQRADEHVGLDHRFLGQRFLPGGSHRAGLSRQLRRPHGTRCSPQVREQLPDAPGLDDLDLQPRQAELQPVAQQLELLALR